MTTLNDIESELKERLNTEYTLSMEKVLEAIHNSRGTTEPVRYVLKAFKVKTGVALWIEMLNRNKWCVKEFGKGTVTLERTQRPIPGGGILYLPAQGGVGRTVITRALNKKYGRV
jgi:hypothetical protein